MKIVLIGAGSCVFAPAVLHDAIVDHRLDGGELVMVDLEADWADVMRDVGRRMALDVGVDIDIGSTTDRVAALPNADFVISSAAVQGARRWQADAAIIHRYGMPDQLAENGGLSGVSYAFRAVSLALDIAADMERLCPEAKFLDCANPMPRVVSAVNRFSKVECIGFCNAAWGGRKGYERVAEWVERDLDSIEVVSAGLNHFAWLLSVRDRQTGEELCPLVEKRIKEGRVRQAELYQRLLDEYGGIGASGGHMIEFIPWNPGEPKRTRPPFHFDADERQRRMDLLREAVDGRYDWRDILQEQHSWERPVDVAAALRAGSEATFDMVNIPNQGYIGELPDGYTVEVPAIAKQGRLTGRSVPELPERVAEICRQVAETNELVAESGAKGDRDIARKAIECDPSIPEKQRAMDALDEMLEAHADILPRFARG